MKVVAVTGDGDRTAVARRLVERLEREGSVGTVLHSESDPLSERSASAPYHAVGSDRHYSLGSGGWVASGSTGESLGDVLDELAPSCDFAVVEGFEDSALPTVVVGDSDADEAFLLEEIPSKEKLDPESVLSALSGVDPYETLESLVARVKRSADSEKSGAIATFTGRVRAKEHDDDTPTEHLEFERYDEVATEKMATIREELEARDGVYEVLMHHKTGVVDAGEDIVFVVVLAGHRPEAFATVEDGIDRLKDEVPLFKKEVTVEGTFWAHQHDPSNVDAADDDSLDRE